MTNLVDKKCISTDWFTPPEILEPVRAVLGGSIPLDPCTASHNPTQAYKFCFLGGHDGLTIPWLISAFVNPPYGKELYKWISKTVWEASLGVQIVFLVSASSRWDQAKWQRLYSPNLTTFVMPRGRVKFLDASGVQQKSPPYPSILYFYNIDPKTVLQHFGHLGTVVKQEVL